MEEVLVGSINLFPYSFTPMGWVCCNGQLLSVMEYQALFSLIGNTYGGNGQTTFGVPNLNGAQPLPTIRYYIATEGIYPSRS